MNSLAAVYKRFGKYLTDPKPKITKRKPDADELASFIKTNYTSNISDYKIKDSSHMIPSLFAKTKSLARLDELVCIECKSNNKVEMHHIRAMKDVKNSQIGLDRLMIRKNRKQIPLCHNCHMRYHREKSNK